MSDRNKAAKGGSSPSSCSVIPTSRSVIEGKLLDALSNDGCVAILASEDDLNVMIAALEYAMLGFAGLAPPPCSARMINSPFKVYALEED
jgi:hypothetical protein